MEDFLDSLTDLVFVDTVAKVHSVMSQFEGKNIVVAYSGGADSDNVMWLLRLCGYKVKAVFYNTGLEYKATWKHIEYMREQGFDIEVIKAVRPVATSNKKFGHPFISKFASEMLSRMQGHNFDFQKDGEKSYEDLMTLYPKMKSALGWWCSKNRSHRLNISTTHYLKEFLIEYGLPFKVSGKCCDGAKKLPVKKYAKENKVDLMLLGIRKAEKGVRSVRYSNCFVPKKSYTYAMYFPLFWWSSADKQKFETILGIKHSDCYGEYGLDRTGCAGCPFGKYFEKELSAISTYEPSLHKAAQNIFKGSYEWTRKYKEFLQQSKEKELSIEKGEK